MVRNLVLGRDYYVESYSDFKTILLSAWYALFCIGACLVYLLLDLMANRFLTSVVFLSCIMVCAFTLVLHRLRYHEWANTVLFPTIGFTIFIFASSESPANGTPMFFLVAALGAFTIFGINKRKAAYLFLVFVSLLFALAYYLPFSLLPYRHYDQWKLIINLSINFTIAISALVMVATLLLRLHHYNEERISKQNDLLKRANAELDRFVYSASHDLRAPLSSVRGLITLAESGQQSEVQHYLGLMKQRISSLENFIHDVTDFSRNNRLGVEKKRVPLAVLTLDIWEGLRFIEGADAIRFKMDIKSELTVFTDPSRLRIVLGNLFSNAIRYHNLQKVDPFIRVSAREEAGLLVLEVEDNGQGIDRQYLPKIFEMFYRANEGSKGSGLGLYIVSEVLAKVNGAIDVESTLGKGTLFRVKIPLS